MAKKQQDKEIEAKKETEVKVTFFVPESVRSQFKIKALQDGTNSTSLLKAFMIQYLAGNITKEDLYRR